MEASLSILLTDVFREDEIQALIALAELAYPVKNPNNNQYQPYPRNIEEARKYFRRFALDLSMTWVSLINDEYSRRVFGKILGQGFRDTSQINRLLNLLKLDQKSQVLDIGCGNDFIWKNIMAESFPDSGPANLELNSAARYLYIVGLSP